tara:strand:- start:38 stop:556 length:519 start_codon:yes stop_codon:yes gene_type:complete
MNKEIFNLRDLKKEDIKEYIDFLSDPEVTVWLEDEVQNIESYANIENYLTYGFYRQAIEHDGKFIGVSGLDLVNDKKKVARFFIVIGRKELWGKGIGFEVIKSVVNYGFKELKLRKINSDFLAPNEAVRIIHEKAGFKSEGFLRKDSFRNKIWLDREIVSIFPDELTKTKDK